MKQRLSQGFPCEEDDGFISCEINSFTNGYLEIAIEVPELEDVPCVCIGLSQVENMIHFLQKVQSLMMSNPSQTQP